MQSHRGAYLGESAPGLVSSVLLGQLGSARQYTGVSFCRNSRTFVIQSRLSGPYESNCEHLKGFSAKAHLRQSQLFR